MVPRLSSRNSLKKNYAVSSVEQPIASTRDSKDMSMLILPVGLGGTTNIPPEESDCNNGNDSSLSICHADAGDPCQY
jgi:hypothetical protein